MYKFRKASDEDKEISDMLTCSGTWIYGIGAGEEKYALFLGKMIALFGDSGNMSDDWENMYNYDIIAEDEQGNKLGIEIYHGPGGPSFAIPTDYDDIDPAPYQQAAKELVEYIEKAEPADYVWESVYYDIPANIKYTVKDGRAYVESKISEEDM